MSDREKQAEDELLLREMRETDGKQVADLEKRLFSDAWSERSIQEAIRARGSFAYVIEEKGRLCGYFLGQQLLDEAEIHRIAVAPERTRRGYGRRLLEQFLNECRKRGVVAQTLEVRSGNGAALALYSSFSFCKEGIRKSYYRDPVEDAWILWRRELC